MPPIKDGNGERLNRRKTKYVAIPATERCKIKTSSISVYIEVTEKFKIAPKRTNNPKGG